MATTLEQLIGETFLRILGGAEIIGIIALFSFAAIISFAGLPAKLLPLVLLPFSIVLAAHGFLPAWLAFIIALGCGAILAYAFQRYLQT